jgi:poly-gamma-glutamate capsule biosynthesis protein CapA/YwtB (metallophosphatase superfamily)
MLTTIDKMMNSIIKGILFLTIPFQVTFAQDTLKVISFGDTYLGSWVVAAIDTNGWDYPFRETRILIQSADLAMVNLEGPLTDCSEPFMEKQYTLRVPPRMCQALVAAGIYAVTMANNHILDFGFPGLEETFKTLSANNISFCGAGMTLPEAYQPTYLTIKETKVALIGYSVVFPSEFWADKSHGGTAFPYQEKVIEALKTAHSKADMIIVQVHWGEELRDNPKHYQTDLAHLLVDHGANVVFGHHAHIPLGIEIYKGVPIFYGLGNFAFGTYSEKARGMGAEVTLVGKKVISGKIIPLNVLNEEVEFSPKVLEGNSKQQFIQNINTISAALNHTRTVLDNNGNLILSR